MNLPVKGFIEIQWSRMGTLTLSFAAFNVFFVFVLFFFSCGVGREKPQQLNHLKMIQGIGAYMVLSL